MEIERTSNHVDCGIRGGHTDRMRDQTLLLQRVYKGPIDFMVDVQFRQAGDDVDICWRFTQAGLRIGYAPAAAHYDKQAYEDSATALAPEWQAIYEHHVLDLLRRLGARVP